MSGVRNYQKYTENPFLDRTDKHVRRVRKMKKEIEQGQSKYKYVDTMSFTLMYHFEGYPEVVSGMSKLSMTLLFYIITHLKRGNDHIYLNVNDVARWSGQKSGNGFYPAIEKLLETKWLARHQSPGWFFVNTERIFAGDRKDYVKTEKLKKNEVPKDVDYE